MFRRASLAALLALSFAQPRPAPADGPGAPVSPPNAEAPVLHRWRGPGTYIRLLVAPADGKVLTATVAGRGVRVWDTAAAKELHTFPVGRRALQALALSPDGRRLAAEAFHGVRVWDLDTWESHDFRADPGMVGSVAFSPDGKWLAAGADQAIQVWDVAAGKEVRRVPTSSRDPHEHPFALGAGGLLVYLNGGRLAAVDVVSGRRLRRSEPLGGPVEKLRLSDDGRLLVGASLVGVGQKVLHLWDVATLSERRRLPVDSMYQQNVVPAPDGRLVAVGQDDGIVRLFEVATGRERRRFAGHPGYVTALAFTPDGRTLVSGGHDGLTIAWDLADRKATPLTLTGGQLKELWNALASGNAADADRARRKLARAPRQAVAFLKERLPPAKTVADERVKRLIQDTDSDQFAVRQSATAALEQLGRLAEPALRAALDRRPAPEARQRMERLLARLEQGTPPSEELRALRAVELLETIRTPEARQLLRRLAGGAAAARLTQEARASLQHLERQAARSQRPPTSSTPEQAAKSPAAPGGGTDRDGNPLPAGALMRLGGGGFRAAGTEALAILDGGRVVASAGNARFYLWDAASGRQIRELDPGRFPGKHPLAASPDGKVLATTDAERKVLLWKVATGRKWRSLEIERMMHIGHLAWSPDGKALAAGGGEGIRILDVETGDVAASLNMRSPQAIAFSPDAKTLAVGGTDSTVRLWRVGSTAEPRLLGTLSRSVGSVAFSPDGRAVAAAGGYYPYGRRRQPNPADRAIILWDAATGKERRRCVGHSGAVLDLAFSPDGRLLASAGENSPVRLWDPATGKQVRACGGSGGMVSALAWMPDGKTLVSAGGTIHLWDVATGREPFASEGHEGAVRAVAFTPDGKTVVSRGADQALCFWDRAAGKQLRKVSGVGRGGCLAVTPDGKTVITGGYDTIVRLWDVATGKEVRQLRGHRGSVDSLAVSADGKLLASAGGDFRVLRNGRDDYAIHMWDLATGKERGRFGDHRDLVRAVCFAPDGKTLASASADGTSRLWDVATGEEVRRFGGRVDHHAIAVSPDGSILVTMGGERAIRFWDPKTSKELGRISLDWSDAVTSMDLSPDGRLLAMGTHEGAIRLWDVRTRRELTKFTGHRGWVAALQFSPDGRVLLSGGADGSLLLWGMTGQLSPTAPLPPREASAGRTGGPPSQASRQGSPRLATDTGPTFSPPATGVTKDHRGDPLPRGALSRIGTVRWQVPDPVVFLACTPDGKTLISGGYRIFFWDTATGRQRRRLGQRSNAFVAAALTADGKWLAYSDGEGRIHLHDVAAAADLRTFGGGRRVHAVAFDPDGRSLAVAADGSAVVIWDVAAAKPVRRLPSAPEATDDVAWSPDGKTLAGVGRDQVLRLWRAADGKETRRLRGFVWRAAFAPDGKMLAALTPDYRVALVDVPDGWTRVRLAVAGLPGNWCRLVFSPDGRRLVVTPGSHAQGRVQAWETASGKEVNSLEGRQSEIIALTFSADGKVVYGGGFENEIHRWDAKTGKELVPEGGHLGVPLTTALSADGRTLITVGRDWICRRRDATTGRALGRFSVERNRCHGVALAPDGSRVAVVDVAGENRPALGVVSSLLVWDTATGKLIRQFRLGEREHYALRSFSADGRLLVCSGMPGAVTVWDLDTGQLRAEVKGQAGFLLSFSGVTAVSPDGTLLAGLDSGREESIILMDAATGTEVRRIGLDRRAYMRHILFSPDGRTLLSSDSETHVCESVTGKERCSFPGASIVALSGDGRLLAGVSVDGTIDMWDVLTGRKVVQFAGQESGIEGLAFSADGRRLASTSRDQTILLWEVPAPVAKRGAARLSGRELAGLWADLADEDAFRAYRAQRRLLASPGQAVNYLKDRLRPVGRTDEIASAEQVRVWRAVELLEHIGTPEARRVLRALAGPAPQSRLPREAEAALDRLEKRAGEKR